MRCRSIASNSAVSGIQHSKWTTERCLIKDSRLSCTRQCARSLLGVSEIPRKVLFFLPFYILDCHCRFMPLSSATPPCVQSRMVSRKQVPSFVLQSGTCIDLLEDGKRSISGEHLLCSHKSPHRPLTCMTAARHPVNATPAPVSEQGNIPPVTAEDDSCPVYCYVACSPTRSDYLEHVLTSRVYDVVEETALERAALLSDRIGNTLLLKREDTTVVKSFKVRGAYNMIAKANPESLKNGVIAASAGNHAQGVALAAEVLGLKAVIVMPAVTPKIKVDAVKRRGAEALLHGDNFDQAKAKAMELADRHSMLFVPPFDHRDVIAGQGTVGLELIRQCSDFDTVFVPVGGGGLIAGIATVVKRLRPSVRIVGVEPVDADALYRSMAAGKRVRLQTVGTFADGVAVIEVGEEPFRLCRDLVDEVILVSNDEICAAIKDVFEDTRSILEPAGALGVAGAKKYAATRNTRGQTFVAITSGANTNFDRLRHVSERAEIGEGREAVFAVTIPERPGAFKDLITALGGKINISEFNYRYAGGDTAHVYVGAAVASRGEASEIASSLRDSSYNVLDMTDNELAKLHIRHLVGGSAPCREEIIRFEFPERPGALGKFLRDLPSQWNITMFHYRNHGADVGRVLVGLDTVDDDNSEVQAFLDRLGYFFVREQDNPAYKFFLSGQRA